MQLLLALAGDLASAAMTAFCKKMAFNPNEGQLAAWLYKLPGLKLPSTRPAVAMFNNRYEGNPGVDVGTIFARASDRKIIFDYFTAQNVARNIVDDAMGFLEYMCRTLVNTSTVFRAHYGDEKTARALLFYILCGQIMHGTAKDVVTTLQKMKAHTVEFDPQSLDDINIEELKTGAFNEVEVAKRIGALTREWFRALKLGKSKLSMYLAPLTQDHAETISKIVDEKTGNELTVKAAKELITRDFPDCHVRIYRKNGHNETIKFAPSYDVSPSEHLIEGSLLKFQKAYPEGAAFFLLCTPTFASAINEMFKGENKTYNSPGWEKRVRDAGLMYGSDLRKKLVKEGWMARYVSEKMLRLSKMTTSNETETPLWMRIQALKAKDFGAFFAKNKAVQFSIDDIEHMTSEQLQRTVKAVGLEDSLTSVFSTLHSSLLFKRKFLAVAFPMVVKIKSPFGDIEDRHLKTNAPNPDQFVMKDDVAIQWIPVKHPVAKFLNDTFGDRKMTEVKELPAATVKAAREELHSFIWGGHNTDFDVIKQWDIPLTAKQKQYIDRAKAKGDYYLIRDGFHGTDTSAAGSILMSGFRISNDNIKAGRSMGSTLYIAPNIDKSLQYIGARYGRSSTRGIIFRGDLIVCGNPPPEHAKDLKGNTDWTRIGEFKTQEIGLVNPNVQFLVTKAYLVERHHARHAKLNNAAAKFSALVPLASVSSRTAEATSPKQFVKGDRVVCMIATDEWYTGTVLSFGKTLRVEFDDEHKATVQPEDFQHVYKIKSKRLRTKALSDAAAHALFA